MEELNKEKISQEIETLIVNRKINVFKAITLLIGSVALFIIIQRPESILNRKLSQETISRERAKIIFELTHKNNNPEEVLFGLSIIEKAYPEEDSEWINEIKDLYNTKLQRKLNEVLINELDSFYQENLYELRIELQELLDKKEKYQYTLISVVDGDNGKGRTGFGPEAVQLSKMIEDVEEQINEVKAKIDKIKVDYKEQLEMSTKNG